MNKVNRPAVTIREGLCALVQLHGIREKRASGGQHFTTNDTSTGGLCMQYR